MIEIIISVHELNRPIHRAIESILDANEPSAVLVTVIRHGLPAGSFAVAEKRFRGENVRWLDFSDGIASPAGPFNFGISQAHGDYVGIMGSDDFFDTGAISAMQARLVQEHSPEVLIYPLRHQAGNTMPNPLSRKGRTAKLHPIKDRLAYRTAPLALIRRDVIGRYGLTFTDELRTGEDVNFSAQLWNSGVQIDFHPMDPAYVIGADAVARVTTTSMPITDELAAFFDLFAREWVRELPANARTSLVIKTVRVHLFGSLNRRVGDGSFGESERAEYARLLKLALALAPSALKPFSLRDRRVLDSVADPRGSVHDIRQATNGRIGASRLQRWITKNPLRTLAREGEVQRLLRYRSWPK